ncbi:B-cell receptor CD22-like isoform X2 [Anoplopoma fimbria]|uniref:B-cell receptor CD22-like isoform X2 n=1 Tax=Anoplopoma fimbria TaxID=229290 RepID=UPI0023EDD0E5|nr:B-cell receptor CD22-like isoform X2 [Anoplopoma fimbria]
MSLTAAVSGFVFFLLSAPVIHSQDDWRVTYTSSKVCALKGSTAEIRCSYTYPYTISGLYTKVEETFWFTKESNDVYVDLRTDPEYSGRVQSHCGNNYCTLTITNVRESDSAEYKFRFTTNQPGEKYTGDTGVSLSVTDLQVQVNRLLVYQFSKWTELMCQSSCLPPGHPHYVWYNNGQKIWGKTSISYSGYFYPSDRISCAVGGYEELRSPSVLIQSPNAWRVTYTPTEVCAFKGATVKMHCIHPSMTNQAVHKTFWFTNTNGGRPVDLTTDSEYSGRVQTQCDKNYCTLTITNLRESDSAEYKFMFTTNQSGGKYTGSPGVTLSVTDPQLQINVRRPTVHSTWTELTCHTKCQLPDHSSYIWYKNGQKRKEETVYFLHSPLNPADNYSCAISGYEMSPSPSVYAPKLPSVSVSPSDEIVEGSSVTLTCSSDANPAAKYTWYKEGVDQDHERLSEVLQLVFSSIQSSDSGQYYCTAENQLGTKTSEYIINVTYPPKLPSVLVSPSDEIVEGSSVTLTCSSDANPAANYTWYKGNQTQHQSPEGIHHFSSISSEDRGIYYCKSENPHGEIMSSSLSVDVQYAPKLPSVSVSPSDEIVEGSSVNLTCSSDANPAANYTWYKEGEDSSKASGQIFTITDIRAEHSGNYYCEARNKRGRHNSTLHLIVVPDLHFSGSWKYTAAGTITVVLLAVLSLSVFLWIRKKGASRDSSELEERRDNREQGRIGQQEEQGDLQYASIHFSNHQADPRDNREHGQQEEQGDFQFASIHFSNNQADPLYSNIRPAQPLRHTEQQEGAEYAAVKFIRAPRIRAGEDPAALYSTVNKN